MNNLPTFCRQFQACLCQNVLEELSFNEIMFLRLSLELENSVYNVRECIAFAFKDAKSNSSSVFIVTW